VQNSDGNPNQSSQREERETCFTEPTATAKASRGVERRFKSRSNGGIERRCFFKIELLRAHTAADLDVLAGRLASFNRDELAQIQLFRWEQNLSRVPFIWTCEFRRRCDSLLRLTIRQPSRTITPKAEIPYELWNRLVEALGPASMGEASKGTQEDKPFTPGRAAQESTVEDARSAHLGRDNSDSKIDKALADSFPASDPPSWTTGREENHEPRISETDADDLKDLRTNSLAKSAKAKHRILCIQPGTIDSLDPRPIGRYGGVKTSRILFSGRLLVVEAMHPTDKA
jgi:hypothetical protein